MESKRKAYLRACSLASSEVPLRTRSRYSTGLKTKHLRLREHDLLAQYGFENSAAACRPSEGYEDIQSETNDVDFTDKSFYNYCTSSRDSVDESLDCDETQRSKDCLAKEALRLNDTNMSSSMNEEETMSDGSPALSMSSDIQNSERCISSKTSSVSDMEEYACEGEDLLAADLFSKDTSKDEFSCLDDKFFEPLYPGSDVTIFEYHTSLFHFSLKHCLTKLAYEDLLKLISQQLPSPNSAMTSLYRLKRFFNHIFCEPVVEKHQYCSVCHHLITKDEVETDLQHVVCLHNCSAPCEEFITCDIEFQLKAIMAG